MKYVSFSQMISDILPIYVTAYATRWSDIWHIYSIFFNTKSVQKALKRTEMQVTGIC